MAQTTSTLHLTEQPLERVALRALPLGEFAGVCFLLLYLLVELEPFELLYPLPGAASSLLVPVGGLCALALSSNESVRTLPFSFVLVGLIAWLGATYLWAESTTFAFVILRNELPGLAILAAVAGTMRPRVIVTTLLGFFTIIGLWSAFSSLTLPDSRAAVLGVGPEAGLQEGWRGTFGHKNILGIFMVLALGLTLTMQQRRRRLPLAVLFVAVIVGTRSATAAGGLVAVLVAFFWMTVIGGVHNTRDRVILKLMSVASLLTAIGVVVGLLPVLVGVYGKDLTFSGRTEIWAASLEAATQRPITGYGVGGIWFDVYAPTTRQLHQAIGFGASHAHNGALNLWLEAGLVGLGLYLLLTVQMIRFAIRALGTPSTAAYGRWAIITVAAVQLMALSEPLFRGAVLGITVVMWITLARIDRMARDGAQGQSP